ncbi:MAG: alpha-isopropylmalate synthase regulatory domain-containing protein, partial [Acutalibacteraceae bacterium]|nr:alpha-isopropylmalate synthase regulatory domain-containing protein [Acutalibacteraceae bacterium]
LAAGADEIKAACGNNMGIAPLLTVSNIVRNSGDRLGISADLNYTEFSRIISQVSNITDVKPATDVSSSAVPYSEFNLTENDDAQTVADAVKKLGYDLSEDDNAKVYEAFKDLAKKKPVSNKELDAIVATNALQVTPAYKLNNYVINSGNIIISSAQITLEKDEQEKNAIAIGDGPIDAAFNAIEQILGHHYELDDFQIQSVTEGREAVGSAIVRLRSNGKLYAGKGISTDIIGASIQAYINAINKIIFEEN